MKHIYKEGEANKPVFVLLHGTGGDENDLLPVAELLDPTYGVLSIRGNISENGMNRFFKRHAEGKYDLEDLAIRGKELQEFLTNFAKEHQLSLEDMVLVGFSNGANIGIHLLVQEETPFKQAMLLAPMYPVELENKKDLSNLDVFLSMGREDPIVSIAESERVIRIFEERNADVTTEWTQGHQLTQEVVAAGKQWLHR